MTTVAGARVTVVGSGVIVLIGPESGGGGPAVTVTGGEDWTPLNTLTTGPAFDSPAGAASVDATRPNPRNKKCMIAV